MVVAWCCGWLNRIFESSQRKRLSKSSRRAARTPLRLECLEDRITPTILFTPRFGAETAADNGGFKLSGVPVYLIYWGSYWNATNTSSITAALGNVLASPYTNSLTQYGTNGAVASISTILSNYPSPQNGFHADDIQGAISNAIDNQGLPEPDDNGFDHSLYVVITPPGTSSDQGGAAGYNRHYNTGGILDSDEAIYAWVSTPAGGTAAQILDGVTATFSHEVVEAMTDPEQGNGANVTKSPKLPANVDSGPPTGQIADFEPDPSNQPHYAYRLSGNLIQPYWSQQDKAFVVPDGNRQRFILDPIWTVAANGDVTFTGQYNLSIQGDQLGGLNVDTVIVSSISGGVQVSLNGEVARFEPNVIKAVNISTGGGADTVLVQASAASLPVTVTSGALSYRYAEPNGSVLYSSAPPVLNGTDLVQVARDPLTGTTFQTTIANNVQSFATANNGATLYALKTDGTLYHQFAGIPFSVLTANVANMVVANSGNTLYVLNGYDILYEAPAGAGDSNPAYYSTPARASVQVVPDGTVYFLARDGSLYNATRGILISGGVQSFKTMPDGTVYLLRTDGNFYNANRGVLISGGVQSFSIVPDGTVYVLTTSGNVYNANNGVLISGGVQSFSTVPDGTVYLLTTAGSLYNANQGILISGSVQSFGTVPDGTIYLLRTDGNLYIANKGILIQGGVASFTVAADGGASFLQNGILYYVDEQDAIIPASGPFAPANSGALIQAATATAAANASAVYNSAAQTITLSATVTSGAALVREGTETFTILNALANNTPVGTAITVKVINGLASASYTLPAGVVRGSYTIQAVYNGDANFQAFTDASHVLTINAAASKTAAVNAAVYNSASATVALSANVTSASGTVNEGTETFSILNGGTVVGSPVTVAVVNGVANASYALPARVSNGSYVIQAVYNGQADYLTSNDASHTLTISPTSTKTAAILKSDGSLWQYNAGSDLQPLSPAGTILSISAVTDAFGFTDVFAVTADTHLWEHSSTGWVLLSSSSFQQLSAATNAAGNAVVFAVLTDNSLYENNPTFPGDHWQMLSPAGSILSISAVTDTAGNDDVYAVTSDTHLWEHTPTGWTLLSAGAFQQVSAGLNGAGQAIVFGVLTDDSLWENNSAFVDNPWHLLSSAGTILSVSAGGADDVFAVTSDKHLWEHSTAGWALRSTGSFESLSGATNTAGQGEVFAVLTDTSFWEYDPAFPGWQNLVPSGVAIGSAARTR